MNRKQAISICTQVEIEATVDAWRGDIAIDELRFTPGFCPVKNIDIAAGSRPTTPAPMIVMPPPYSKKLYYMVHGEKEHSDWFPEWSVFSYTDR